VVRSAAEEPRPNGRRERDVASLVPKKRPANSMCNYIFGHFRCAATSAACGAVRGGNAARGGATGADYGARCRCRAAQRGAALHPTGRDGAEYRDTASGRAGHQTEDSGAAVGGARSAAQPPRPVAPSAARSHRVRSRWPRLRRRRRCSRRQSLLQHPVHGLPCPCTDASLRPARWACELPSGGDENDAEKNVGQHVEDHGWRRIVAGDRDFDHDDDTQQ
jgi:hypothetical protein